MDLGISARQSRLPCRVDTVFTARVIDPSQSDRSSIGIPIIFRIIINIFLRIPQVRHTVDTHPTIDSIYRRCRAVASLIADIAIHLLTGLVDLSQPDAFIIRTDDINRSSSQDEDDETDEDQSRRHLDQGKTALFV